MHDDFFRSILEDRINSIRKTFSIDEDYQMRGQRFKSTGYATEAVEGSIIMRKNRNIKGSIIQEAMGLDFDPNQILDGKFDPLIRTILKHLASMDFEAENRLDRN